MKNEKRFKPQIFVCPADEISNESISKDPSLEQEEPCRNVDCYFGKNKIKLSLFPVNNLFWEFLKKSKWSFYAFIQNEKDGAKQYFHSQNLKKKPDNSFAIEMARLLEEFQRIKKVKEVVI